MAALRTYIGSTLTAAAQAEGVSEDFYFLRHLNQASKGDAASLAIIQSVRTAANSASDSAAVAEFDEMIANANILTSAQTRRLYVDAINGSDVTGNGSLAKPYLTMDPAMTAVTGASTVAPWTIFTFNGNHLTLPDTFAWKANVRLVCLDAVPATLVKTSRQAIANNGNGIFSATNLNVGALKISVTASSTVNLTDCTQSSNTAGLRFQVTCIADVAGSLAGKYFLLDTPLNNYYIWYRVSGSGTDPAVSGRKGLVIDLVTNDTAATIASKSNTQLGQTVQLRAHNNDFAVTQSNLIPAGIPAFQIRPIISVDSSNIITDFNTGFTFASVGLSVGSPTPTPGGIELIGTSSTNQVGVNIVNCQLNGPVFMKFAGGSITGGTLAYLAIDSGTGAQVNTSVVGTTNFAWQIKGNCRLTTRDGRTDVTTTPSRRLIGSTSSAPILNTDASDTLIGVRRFVGSIANGNNILTLVSGVTKATLHVGAPLSGPGIPADTFVGDSTDLISTQIRMLNSAGAAQNATQTRSSISINWKNISFEDGALNSQFVTQSNSLLSSYTPLNSVYWPSSNQPTADAQALDVLASKRETKETVVLSGAQITAQAIDLTNLYISGSVDVEVRTAATPLIIGNGHEGASFEYTTTTYTDVNGVIKTRLTFVTNWATGGGTALVAGDTLHIKGLIQDDNF